MNRKSMLVIIASGGLGFLLATLLVTVGFFKTILILVVTGLAALAGYLLEVNNVDVNGLIKKLFGKN